MVIGFFTGVLVPGGFGTRGIEGKIAAAHWARTNDKPFLGICLGLQCAVIEFARNVLNMKDAHTTEIDPNTSHPVVIDMPEHNQGQMGGTMRLGKRTTTFTTQNSIMRQLYGNQVKYCLCLQANYQAISDAFCTKFLMMTAIQ
jgi:CTP synthase